MTPEQRGIDVTVSPTDTAPVAPAERVPSAGID
jgi:hypothetical protein